MDTIDEKAEREWFEARAKSSGYMLRRHGDEYYHSATQHAWQGWMMRNERTATSVAQGVEDTADKPALSDEQIAAIMDMHECVTPQGRKRMILAAAARAASNGRLDTARLEADAARYRWMRTTAERAFGMSQTDYDNLVDDSIAFGAARSTTAAPTAAAKGKQ